MYLITFTLAEDDNLAFTYQASFEQAFKKFFNAKIDSLILDPASPLTQLFFCFENLMLCWNRSQSPVGHLWYTTRDMVYWKPGRSEPWEISDQHCRLLESPEVTSTIPIAWEFFDQKAFCSVMVLEHWFWLIALTRLTSRILAAFNVELFSRILRWTLISQISFAEV